VTLSICSWNFGSTSSIEQRTFKYHSKKNLDKIIALNDATGKNVQINLGMYYSNYA
jgi:hypothetical protein